MFAAPPKTPDAPPVRRAPVPLASVQAPAAPVPVDQPVSAEVLADAAALPGAVEGDSNPTGGTESPSQGPPAQPFRRRRGSPFAESHVAASSSLPAVPALNRPARPYVPPPNPARLSAATGGAIASIFLGVFGLCGSYFIPLPALVVAVFGIGMGLWGIYSERRGLAIAGLLLCCITLAVAGFFGAVELFTYMHGYRPWELDPSLQPDL
jgi:hypothetical protein